MLEAHVLASINASTQQLLLIGDHQQLRPSAACHELTLKYGLNVSLFERALNNDVPYVRLRTQRRMRPSISRLIRPIYKDLLDHESTKGRPPVAGLASCVHFITHAAPERSRDELLSPENPHEVTILTMLAALLHGLGYAEKRMTVLSAYVGQLLLLRAAFAACGLSKVLISTVDAYQGEENDIILLSLVRSNERGTLGFTSVDNRVCVALSRARLGFFCACDLEMLGAGSKLWATLQRHTSMRSAQKKAEFVDNASRITWVGGVVNLVLAALKLAAGICGRSAAMIADAGHSFSDLVSDAVTLLALRLSSLPADVDHPYGTRPSCYCCSPSAGPVSYTHLTLPTKA